MTAPFLPTDSGDLVRVDVSTHGPSVRLTVAGEVDSSSAGVLARHLSDALAGAASTLVVDLCGVTFLDSAGLSTLANAHRRAGQRQVTMRVLAATRAVVRPLQITGLWRLLAAEQVDPEHAADVVA